MPEPATGTTRSMPSPNSVELDDMEHWLKYALFNELPHISLFDSMHHLCQDQLQPLFLRDDWQDVLATRRREMAQTNERRKQEGAEVWRLVLDRISNAWKTHGRHDFLRSGFDADIHELYGVEVLYDNRSFPVSRDLRNFRATTK